MNRWIRLDRLAFGVHKIDVLAYGEVPDYALVFPTYARSWRFETLYDSLECDISLRTDCTAPPPPVEALKNRAVLDVLLCPPSETAPHLQAWLEACRGAELPIRIQFQAPFQPDVDVAALADRVAQAGVVTVNIVLSDPFRPSLPCPDATSSRRAVDTMNALTAALADRNIEVNLIGLPLCLTTERTRGHAENTCQFFRDHQQYDRPAYELAVGLYHRPPRIIAKLVMLLLMRNASFHNPFDGVALNWLYAKHPLVHSWLALFRKLAYDLRLWSDSPEHPATEEYLVERETRWRRKHPHTPTCRSCALHRICDGETQEFKRLLPGLSVVAQRGDVQCDPMHHLRQQPKYCDTLDAFRLQNIESAQAFAREARDHVANDPPTHIITVANYGIDKVFFEPLSGAVRWHALTRDEQVSIKLGEVRWPLSISVTFGGGIAQYIGFRVFRHGRLLCPMVAYSHRLTLYVNEEGRYVLLRDGEPVQPVEFNGPFYVPLRLPRGTEIRLAVWNMDETIGTQDVEVWEGYGLERTEPAAKPKFSVIVVCSRLAQHLQAVLQSIAHQRDFPLDQLEVVVAYVPGIDATDDVIDSFHLTHPDLRLVRSAFTTRQAQDKGFMLDESRKLASGEWILALDTNVLLPPNLFARAGAATGSGECVAPEGCKALDAETTARILLGDLEPWRAWDDLLARPGASGQTVPEGACQLMKSSNPSVSETRLDGLSVAVLESGGHGDGT